MPVVLIHLLLQRNNLILLQEHTQVVLIHLLLQRNNLILLQEHTQLAN